MIGNVTRHKLLNIGCAGTIYSGCAVDCPPPAARISTESPNRHAALSQPLRRRPHIRHQTHYGGVDQVEIVGIGCERSRDVHLIV